MRILPFKKNEASERREQVQGGRQRKGQSFLEKGGGEDRAKRGKTPRKFSRDQANHAKKSWEQKVPHRESWGHGKNSKSRGIVEGKKVRQSDGTATKKNRRAQGGFAGSEKSKKKANAGFRGGGGGLNVKKKPGTTSRNLP